MTTFERASRNVILLIGAQGINYAFAFLTNAYAARYLGPAGFGVLSFGIAFTGILSIFSDLGFRKLIARDLARDKTLIRRYMGNIVVIRFLSLGVIGTCGVFFMVSTGYPVSTVRVVYLLLLGMACRVFSEIIYALFQSQEDLRYEAVGNVLYNIMLLVGTGYSIISELGVEAIARVYFLSSLIILIYSVCVCSIRFQFPFPRFEWAFWKDKIPEALPFGLVGFFEVIYHWLDTIMLSVMQSAQVVGWYNAAYRLFLVSLFASSSVNLVIFPIISKMSVSSKDITLLRTIYDKYFKFMTIIGIGLGIGATFLADRIVLLVYGEDYMPSVLVFQVLMGSAVLIFINSAFVRLFESTGGQLVITKVAGIAAALNIVLNFLLIPSYSYIGASIATVLSELLITVWLIAVASKSIYGLPASINPVHLFRVALSGLFMGLFIWSLNGLVSFMILAPAAVVVYCGAIYFLNVFDAHDLSIISQFALRFLPGKYR
jgi:O-antigen/teichoic acid export membrane protein